MSQTTSTDDARIAARRATGHTVQAIAAIENLSDTQVRNALARHAATPEYVLEQPAADERRAAYARAVRNATQALHAATTRARIANAARADAETALKSAARALADSDHPDAVREETTRDHPDRCACGAQLVACAAVGIEPAYQAAPSAAAMSMLAAGHRATAAAAKEARAAHTMPGARRAQIAADPRPHPNSARARRLTTTAATARATT